MLSYFKLEQFVNSITSEVETMAIALLDHIQLKCQSFKNK